MIMITIIVTTMITKEAVELLKLTGGRVRLKICRYLRGLKFEQLQDGVIHR